MNDNFYLTDERIGEVPPYNYRDCGIEGIYLLNGVTHEEHDGETCTSIKDLDGLHWAIGKHLARNRKTLNSAEIRFLRKTMDLSQQELGHLLGKTSQSVARWEKGTEIPATAEKLLRALFLAKTGDEQSTKDVMEFLTKRLEELDAMDEVGPQPVQFRLNQHWTEGGGRHAA